MTEVTVVVQDTPDVAVSIVGDVVVATILTIPPTPVSSVPDPITNSDVNTISGTVEQSILQSVVGPNPLPGDSLKVGRVLRIRAGGDHTETLLPIAITFRIKFNGVDLNVGGQVIMQNRGTNQGWWIECDVMIKGVGTDVGYSSVFKGQFRDGTGLMNNALASFDSASGIDTTIDNTIDITAESNLGGGTLRTFNLSIENVGG